MNISTTDARALFTKMLVDVYRERTTPTSFLRSFFKVKEGRTKEVSIEVQRGTEMIAVDVERGTEGNRNKFSKSTEKIFVPPYYREYFDATDLDLYDRMFGTGEIEKLSSFLRSTSSFKVQTVFSHLAASEEAGQDDFTLQQFQLFSKAAKELQDKLGYSFLSHISNSAAAIRHPQLQMDMIRLGIGLYGVDSSGSNKLNLQTVATLKSTIAQLKHLKKGESVSYNRKAVVEKDAVIATIRIGYADGYPRRLGNGVGKVWLHNTLAPVIGTVCMDMFMIDVTEIPGVQEGEDVIIFGSQLPVQLLAQWANTIPYEIMTGVSQRVKRIYFEE